MADPFDAIIDRMTVDSAMTGLAVSRPKPDAAARANDLARQTGVPPETADRNLSQLESDVETARARRVMEKYPTVATWALNPRNAAVGADDMESLAKNAAYWKAFAAAHPNDNIGPLQAPAPTIWNSIKGIGTAFSEGFKQMGNAVDQIGADYLPKITLDTPGIPSLGNNASANALKNYQESQFAIDIATPGFKSALGRGLYGGTSSLAQMLPSIGLAVATGQPGIGLAAAGLQQGLPAYSKYRGRGASPNMALLGGALEGGIEVATEKIPMGFLVDKLGKVGARHFVAGFIGRELPTEIAATVGQNAVDTAIANPNKTWGQYLAEQPDAIVQTAIGTLVMAGAFGGLNRVGRRFAARDAAQQQAIDSADGVSKAMDAAGESKVRARDPEAYRAFVALHTDGTPSEHMFIPAEKVATYFQSMGMDYRSDAFWGDYADQIDEGVMTGGDVVLPTADAAAHLAGTPTWEALKPDVRTSPGGMSMSEAESLKASHAQSMEQMGAHVAEQVEAQRKADEPRQRVYQDVRDKLTGAGYTQDAAHTNAELVAQRYATRAERLGQPLTGNETKDIAVNSVLPESLAGIVAADPGRVALKNVINVMRGKAKPKTGPSLLDWIAKRGGIEDRGGDIASMGAGRMKGVARKGERKVIRDHADLNQGEMMGDAPASVHGLDETLQAAIEAGYFPDLKRDHGTNVDNTTYADKPDTQVLLDAIRNELHGTPTHIEGTTDAAAQVNVAASDLARILDQADLDPATATEGEIAKAIDSYRQAQEGAFQQTFADGPRGQISFTQGKSVIDLFESRNMSTFAHEMGHQWLEELRQDAERADAPDQLKADWQAAQDWFKANGHGLKDGAIPVDAHELWARGFERFVMEGKSPSNALRRVFDAFKSWLLHIYQVADNLNAPITPEIRAVMQRLVATDEEIAQADERQNLTATFDREQLGMSEAEFAAFQSLASDAKNEAHDALLFKTMAEIRRSRTKAWKDEEAGVRDDITARVNRRPEFKALHLLRTGRMLDDAEAAPVKVKLDRQQLIDIYGEGVLASLPKGVPPLYAETNTTHADDIAERVGFATGDEMVRTLITLEERKRELAGGGDKRSVRQVLIDEETAAEMRDRHGDPLNDGSIEEEALAAVHNDKQGEVMAAELRSLGRRANRQPTPYALAKDWARDKIASSTVQEAVSGAAIQRYARAAAKAGKAAEKAMLAGDIDETYKQKQAQMLNNALVGEAGRVRDAVAAARDRLASFAKRRTIKSMDQDYLEQIHELLEQVEFRQRSQTQIARQQSFEEWARAREAEGHDIAVPASFATSLGTTHWSRLTTEKLLGLDDTVKQIAHLGRLKQKLIDGKEAREYQEVVDEALGSIDKLPPRPPTDLMEPGFGDRLKGRIAGIDSALLKMETVFDWLDGGNSEGVFNRVVFKPIADAQTREQDMQADYFARIRTAMGEVPGETIKRWMDRVQVPELINRETGNPFVLSRQQLVSIALNMGNEGNAQRLADGYGWNQTAVLTALNRELNASEWQFVQKTWDIIETLWPEIAAMERRVNGVEPDKVVARPVETSAGTLRGGYYPAIYDTARSVDAERHAGSSADLLETTYTKATTRASATKDRSAKVSRPILLQLGVINRHLGEVIHDITHREVLMNADKFLSDKRVIKAIDNTLGREVRGQFRPWLKFVANQWAMERSGNEGIGAFIGKLRANTTAVGMGFRVSTIMTQIAGYSNSFEVVGAKWVSAAIAQTTAHPVETFRTVMEKSGEVRHRMDTLDRDINAGINSLAGKRDLYSDAKRFMYHGIGYTDRMVVLPTWIGAYNKALAGGATEEASVYEADKAMRQSQGAGAAKDLAAIQRGTGTSGELLKITTMFYSYFSAVYQRQRTLGRDTGAALSEHDAKALPGLLARAWWLVVVPPVASALIAGRGPGDDEDWGVWSFKQMLFNALGPIPFVRDLAQPIWDGVAGNKSFGYQLSPMQRAGDTVVNTFKDIGKAARGEDTKQMTRDVMETAGYATGVPPGQIASATQFLVDLGYGDQHAETAADWYRGLTTGKSEPKKP